MLRFLKVDAPYMDEASRWIAVRDKDPAADGIFVFCVKTTKIFCRPTCKARLPRRANVEFKDTFQSAQEAGYRPCKRCQPGNSTFVPNASVAVDRVCAYLNALPIDAPCPALHELALKAGLTKHYFHRAFKRITGVTPRQYAANRRRLRDDLNDQDTESPTIESVSGLSRQLWHGTGHSFEELSSSTDLLATSPSEDSLRWDSIAADYLHLTDDEE